MRKERPILFSTPMVQAILEGRKTMTRRVVKKLALEWLGPDMFTPEFVADSENKLCPYGIPGDIIWVRETHFKNGDEYIYLADGTCCEQFEQCECSEVGKPKWKPSIHMPKEAARLWLETTDIRVERLHDITDADIIAEGVQYPVNNGAPVFKLGVENSAADFMPKGFMTKDATPITEHDLLFAHWAELWCSINGRESWDANPWLWVISFNVLSTTGKPENI